MLLHTADWHLGKILDGVSLLADQRDWFMRFCNDAAENRPELIVICGDLFDFNGCTDEAAALFSEVTDRLLRECGCPILASTGNHDRLPWLSEQVRPFADRGFTLLTGLHPDPFFCRVDGKELCIHALPFLGGAELTELRVKTPEEGMRRLLEELSLSENPECLHVAMAHGLILPRAEESVKRVLAANRDNGETLIDSALLAPFAYAALGHIHAVMDAPPCGHYAGSPLIYDPKEIGQPKGFCYVSFAGEHPEIRVSGFPPVHPVRRLSGRLEELLQTPEAEIQSGRFYLEVTDRILPENSREKLERVFCRERDAACLRIRYAPREYIHPEGEGVSEWLAAFLKNCGLPLFPEEEQLLRCLEEEMKGTEHDLSCSE